MDGEAAAAVRRAYHRLRGLLPLIAEHHGGRMLGVLQGNEASRVVELGGYRLRLTFPTPRTPGEPPAAGLVIALTSREYVVAGHGFHVEFLSKRHGLPNVEYLSIDEGEYEDGAWVAGRRLNGDELHVHLPAEGGVRRAKLHSYA